MACTLSRSQIRLETLLIGSQTLIGNLRGVGGGGVVGGLNTYNQDLIRPISGSIVSYPPPPYPPKGPYETLNPEPHLKPAT